MPLGNILAFEMSSTIFPGDVSADAKFAPCPIFLKKSM